jgi:hypothetical protein
MEDTLRSRIKDEMSRQGGANAVATDAGFLDTLGPKQRHEATAAGCAAIASVVSHEDEDD